MAGSYGNYIFERYDVYKLNSLATTLVAAAFALIPLPSWSQTDIVFVSPFKAGGSTLPFIKDFAAQIEQTGIAVDQRFLGNCRLASQILNRTKTKYLYVWASDLQQECLPPQSVTAKNLVGMLFVTPMYMCGRLSTLDQYRDRPAIMGTNPGAVYTALSEQIRDKINSNIKIVNYANSGAIKAAIVTGEIDLVFHSSGKALSRDNLVTCYAATAAEQIKGLDLISDIIGHVPHSQISNTFWIAGVNLTAQEMANIREIYSRWTKSKEFASMINTAAREAPSGTIDQQISQIHKSLQ